MRWKMLLTMLLLAVPHLVFAQGSGTPRIGASSRGDFPHNVTRSVKGIIMDINLEQGLVLVQDKDGERVVAKVDERTKFKADKKTELRELSEAKELMLEHFQVGQAVKMRYEAKTNRLVELKLRKT